jgi:hypothetical protein
MNTAEILFGLMLAVALAALIFDVKIDFWIERTDKKKRD